MKKRTNIIYYLGGCYGTFFEWLYYYFDNSSSVVAMPFSITGSSHNYVGNFFSPPERIFDYTKSSDEFSIARIHPDIFEKALKNNKNKTNWYNIVCKDLEYLNQHFHKIIVIYPSENNKLWVENNVLEKCKITDEEFKLYYEDFGIKKSSMKSSYARDVPTTLKYICEEELKPNTVNRWGKKSLLSLDIWELRELVSLYWDSRFNDDFICYDKIKLLNFSNIKFISLNELKKNPLQTIQEYLEFSGIQHIPFDKLKNIIDKWYSLQTHMNKDTVVDDIVQSTINNQSLSWVDKKLTLLDEAYIQKKLRDNNFELKCFNLNTFPTNSDDLSKLIERLE